MENLTQSNTYEIPVSPIQSSLKLNEAQMQDKESIAKRKELAMVRWNVRQQLFK
jgi:hypothetical protein